MTRRSISLFAIAAACAAVVSISISSCDNSSSPTTATNNGGIDRSKGPEVLSDECKSTIAITYCPTPGVGLGYDEDGNLIVSNLAGVSTGSVTSSFSAPATNWHASIDASFPLTDGNMTFEAQDATNTTEAKVAIAYDGTGYTAAPEFFTHPGGGEPLYDVHIYDNGILKASQLDVEATKVVRIYNCVIKITEVRWGVFSVNRQCVWRLNLNPCCIYRFLLPNGLFVDGNQIRFVEKNSNGFYVYVQTARVVSTSNIPTMAIKSASALSM